MEVDVGVARLNLDSTGAFDHAQVISACCSCRILGMERWGRWHIYKQRQTSLARAYVHVRVHLATWSLGAGFKNALLLHTGKFSRFRQS